MRIYRELTLEKKCINSLLITLSLNIWSIKIESICERFLWALPNTRSRVKGKREALEYFLRCKRMVCRHSDVTRKILRDKAIFETIR